MQTSLTLAKRDEQYFSFLRFACGIKSNCIADGKEQIQLINQFPKYRLLIDRLTPLILKHAESDQIFDKLDSETQSCLIRETQKGQVKQIAKDQQLQRIIRWCADANISILLLKSTAFQHYLYSNDAPRLSNDIDILVHSRDWLRAQSVFEHHMRYEAKQRPDVFGDLYELSFKPTSAVGDAVDLHKSLTYPMLFDLDENLLWQSSVKHVKYQSEKVRHLSLEFALVHQAVHAFSDLDFSKYNLVDSHTLISKFAIDWQELETIVNQTNTRRVMYVLLHRLVHVMSTPVPEQLLNRLKPSAVRQWIITKLLGSATGNEQELKPLSYRLKQLIAQYAFTDKFMNPIKFQWLFICSAVQKVIGKNTTRQIK